MDSFLIAGLVGIIFFVILAWPRGGAFVIEDGWYCGKFAPGLRVIGTLCAMGLGVILHTLFAQDLVLYEVNRPWLWSMAAGFLCPALFASYVGFFVQIRWNSECIEYERPPLAPVRIYWHEIERIQQDNRTGTIQVFDRHGRKIGFTTSFGGLDEFVEELIRQTAEYWVYEPNEDGAPDPDSQPQIW